MKQKSRKHSRNKKYQSRDRTWQGIIQYIALCLWVIACFLPAFVSNGDPTQSISGLDSFIMGAITAWIVISNTTWAWFANIFSFILYCSYWMRPKKARAHALLGLIVIILTMVVFSIGEVPFKNESDIISVRLGIGGYMWVAAMILPTLIPIRRLLIDNNSSTDPYYSQTTRRKKKQTDKEPFAKI